MLEPLPIDALIAPIVAALRVHRAVVVVAEPGAGKTTRVPPAVMRSGLLSADHPRLVMLQPRRVAARASATRIAQENGWILGKEVGYQVRFEKVMGASTPLRIVTEGILTRQLADNPYLDGVGGVILDEFHERSIHTDLAIALLMEIRQTVRPDLLIIVMSATLDAKAVAGYLGNCPIIESPGRLYPVEILHQACQGLHVVDCAIKAIMHALSQPRESTGDILVFLPGAAEISSLQSGLRIGNDVLVLPLHGSMPFEQQIAALAPSPFQKVILSTNIAQTSLTLPDVRTVIDSGLARVARFDAARGMDRLDLEYVSKASLKQRAGRAGRVASGACVRLFSAKEEAAFASFDEPEIRRVDLAPTVLLLHSWGHHDVQGFGWFDAPDEAKVEYAEQLLVRLGALEESLHKRLTDVGHEMLTLPVHPRLARLLVEAQRRNMGSAGATVAALLSEKDILDQRWSAGPSLRGNSDLAHRAELLRLAEQSRFSPALRDQGIDPLAARQVARARDELLHLMRISPHDNPNVSDEDLSRLALLAYPDRVVRQRGVNGAGVMVGGAGVRLANESIVRDAEFYLALDVRLDQRATAREGLVRIASRIEKEWLIELFPALVRRERVTEYDVQKKQVVTSVRQFYLDLLLNESFGQSPDRDEAGRVLAEALSPHATSLFAADVAAQSFLARVALLRRSMSEYAWPTFDPAQLIEILTRACLNAISLEEVTSRGLSNALLSELPYPLDLLLAEHAPMTIEAPTGNRIAVVYEMDRPPTMAVRLQELFGLMQTPRVAGGRVPIVLHLLAPNYRPVQITSDLASFWASAYFEVRKDLRKRYPKHAWPEDPLTASPEARGRRRP